MSEPEPIDVAKSLLYDARPGVRSMALRILATEEGPESEYLLARLVFDSDQALADSSLDALLQRNPWLKLKPFFVRELPPKAQETRQGQQWAALCAGFREELGKQLPEMLKDRVFRWLKLPGFLPELVDSLEQLGLPDIATKMAQAGDLYGKSPASQGQVLFAPTYHCNIDCSYCYAKEWSRQPPSHLPPESFDPLFGWLRQVGLNHLNICGGEPTTYRYLDELLVRAEREGVRISITTNGIYGARIRKILVHRKVAEIVGHYDQEIMQTKPRAAARFLDNLRDAQRSGSSVLIRYTLTGSSNQTEWRPMLEMAQQLAISSINYGVAFGNMEGTNTYYDFEFGERDPMFEDMFVRFAEDCHSRGLRLHQCKPIPLCTFSLPTLTRYLLDGTLRASCGAYLSDCTRNLTINPDLSTFPCNAIGVKGPPISQIVGLDDAAMHFRPLISDLLKRPFSLKCEACFLFYRGFCQGVCMAQHYLLDKKKRRECTA